MKILRQKAHYLNARIHIGKEGLTPQVEKELFFLLKRRGLVKVKLLRSAIAIAPKKEYFAKLAKHGIVVQKIGLTITLYKKGFPIEKITT